MRFYNRYGQLVGFFLGEFQYFNFKNNEDLFHYFKENKYAVDPSLFEINEILNDAEFDWQGFCDESNIYFESKKDFLNYLLLMRSILLDLKSNLN